MCANALKVVSAADHRRWRNWAMYIENIVWAAIFSLMGFEVWLFAWLVS